jgi:hypothetical protein
VRRSLRRRHHRERFQIRPDRHAEQLEHGIAFDGADVKVGNDKDQLVRGHRGTGRTRVDARLARVDARLARADDRLARAARADARLARTAHLARAARAARVATAAARAAGTDDVVVVVGKSCCRIHC